MPDTTALHQSSGFCSDQPGCGKMSGYSCVTSFTIVPTSSTSSSLHADVPRSIPIKYMAASFSAAAAGGRLRRNIYELIL